MIKILKDICVITKQSNKSFLYILQDYMRLYKLKGLQWNEYFKYSFEIKDENFKRTFLGTNEQRYYLDYLNPKKYYILARNKYFTHLLLDKLKLPKAKLYCYYDPEIKTLKNDSIGYDLNSVLTILKNKNIDKCVIKATEKSHGEGVYAVSKIEYDEYDAILILVNGKTIKLSQVLIQDPLIFESYIEQTQQFKKFNESSINTVRMMTVLLPNHNAKVIASFIKIGRQGAFVDNAGAGGNVDVGVDVKTGKLYNSMQFNGFRNIKLVNNHPDNNESLNGIQIENWQNICKKVIDFQLSIPFIKAIGWDIAITNEGPLVIEINDFWDTTGQLFINKGWRYEIRDCYLKWKKHNAEISVSYPFERQNNLLKKNKLERIIRNE